ncbi:MAG: Holliday junction resolvase [Candidatus Thermoplasmatota archaeon]
MSSQYERELKGIFEGDNVILERVTKRCSDTEKSRYLSIKQKTFIVVRAAGSFGFDLVALRGDISFLIEVKASVTETLHFSSVNGKLQQQAERIIKECTKTKTLPIYAYRLKSKKGDPWRIFTIDIKGIEGRLRILHQRLPKLAVSKEGCFIMRWNDGMPLSELIGYLTS